MNGFVEMLKKVATLLYVCLLSVSVSVFCFDDATVTQSRKKNADTLRRAAHWKFYALQKQEELKCMQNELLDAQHELLELQMKLDEPNYSVVPVNDDVSCVLSHLQRVLKMRGRKLSQINLENKKLKHLLKLTNEHVSKAQRSQLEAQAKHMLAGESLSKLKFRSYHVRCVSYRSAQHKKIKSDM